MVSAISKNEQSQLFMLSLPLINKSPFGDKDGQLLVTAYAARAKQGSAFNFSRLLARPTD